MQKIETLVGELKAGNNIRQTLSELRTVTNADDNAADLLKNDDKALNCLLSDLHDDDPKVRKSAALLSGSLELPKNSDYRKELIACYENEQTLFARDSYLKGLIASGGKNILDEDDTKILENRLVEIDTNEFPEEDMKHILSERKQLVKLIGEGKKKKAVFKRPGNMLVLMVPVKDMYEPLKAEIRSRGITKGFSSIGVLVSPTDFERVRDLRVYDHLKYLVPGEFSLDTKKLDKELSVSGLEDFIKKAYNEKVSFRTYIHEKNDAGRKRAKMIAGEIARLSGGEMINEAPYDCELHFYKKKSGDYSLFIRPLTEDERFSYAEKRLSTSMQPVKAAIMVSLISEFIGSYARVCDIFAGNGTLLMERDETLKTKVMFACDTNEEAVLYGRENAARKGVVINYVHRSAFTFESSEKFDEIISELPDLYDKSETDRNEFFEKLGMSTKRLLGAGGKAFYLTSRLNEMRAMTRKTKGLSFIREIPFDEKRNIFVLEMEK